MSLDLERSEGQNLKIISDGVTSTASRLLLTSRSSFLHSIINSIDLCQCEAPVLIMTGITPQQIQEALSVVSGEFLHRP